MVGAGKRPVKKWYIPSVIPPAIKSEGIWQKNIKQVSGIKRNYCKILTKDNFWKDLIIATQSIKKAGMVQGSRNCCNFLLSFSFFEHLYDGVVIRFTHVSCFIS